MFLSQQKYASIPLVWASMHQYKPISTSLASKNSFVSHGDEPFKYPIYFCSIIGALQLTLTRPNLLLAVNLVCQHTHTTTLHYFKNVKRIFCFISGTTHLGL